MNKHLPFIFGLLLCAASLLSPSCANTTQAPSGGKKDTIPPMIVNISPLPGVTNVSVNTKKIVFTFNEYVTIKNPKSILLSPPLEQEPKARIVEKNLLIEFETPLKPNTTYSLDLNDAIADNNEGNAFPGYTYAFSTGNCIDSMMITGRIRDSRTLELSKGATVLLYKDFSDSALYLHKPDAVSKTDKWGYFILPFIKDTLYRLYALMDENNNMIYDSGAESVAFLDSAAKPAFKIIDTLPEFMKYDMRDTVGCEARKVQYEMLLFKEKTGNQFIKNKGMSSIRQSFVKFNIGDTWIDSLWIKGFKPKNLISQFNQDQDSLIVWINDRRPMPDTLRMYVNYRKTDSLGVLSPFVEELKLDNKANNKKYSKYSNVKLEVKDTSCTFKVTAKPETIEQEGFVFEFDNPIIYENFSGISLTFLNLKEQTGKASFTFKRDTSDVRKYILTPQLKYNLGFSYKLKIPAKAFRDINGYYSDSLEVKVTLPNDDKLSEIKLNLKNVDALYLVELLSESKEKILSYQVSSNRELRFPYLKEGKYFIRLTSDKNGNSQLDPGSVLGHKQPEKVVFYKFNDKEMLILPPGTELNQDIDIKSLF